MFCVSLRESPTNFCNFFLGSDGSMVFEAVWWIGLDWVDDLIDYTILLQSHHSQTQSSLRTHPAVLTVKLSSSYHRVLFLGQSLRMTNNLPFLRPFCMQWKTNKYNSYLASYLSLHGKWINTGVWNMKVCLLADINRIWYCCMLLFRAALNCSLG